ncbi:MAG: DUF2797 domain-containing protein [Gammaproteobacteria bacterium]
MNNPFSLTGRLNKLRTELQWPVNYYFPSHPTPVLLNDWLGKSITLKFAGEIQCIQCDRHIKKSFQQGYCYPCLQKLYECNLCVIHPEKCRYHEGRCNPNDWFHAHCGQPHVVYLANSSTLKVGITRSSHIPSRWIDQGATQGLVIAKVSNRHQAGQIEVICKKHLADKTHWQAMLKQDAEDIDLRHEQQTLFQKIQGELESLSFSQEIVWEADTHEKIQYPVLEYPKKIKTLDFHQQAQITGTLLGIKGQYLILDTGVLSLRKFAGYLLC